MNITLMWMMLLPIIGAGVVYYFNQRHLPWWGWIAAAVPGMAVIGLLFALSYGGAVSDTEIWNGQITSKERVHGTYEEPYECMCSTDSKGNRSCSTCYRTHYTVHWYAHSTIGRFTVDSEDSTWRSVYNTPDPARYTTIQPGDPCSSANSYTNYVQAVPESLFAAVSGDMTKRYANLLPPYPDRIYDLYKINRFVTVGFNFTDAAQWNHDISMMLRELGPKKQVNVIVVVVKTTDTDYQFALQKHWEGVNKNDVVLVIGSEDGTTVSWTSVLSWTKNEIFKVELNDQVRELGVIDRTKIVPMIGEQIAKNFERRRMREFEYLKGEIDPPMWLILLAIALMGVGYSAGGWYLHQQNAPRRYGRFR